MPQDIFPLLLLEHVRKRPNAIAIREKKYGIWQTLTWRDFADLVKHLACGIRQAGLARGEHVVLIGDNRPRLYATMLAAQAVGAVPVALYQDATAQECEYPINHTQARFAFVEDQEQVDKLLTIRSACPALEYIYYDDPRGLRNYHAPNLQSADELIESGRRVVERQPNAFEAMIAAVRPDQPAGIFFTSGTTGNPKGVVHTHRTLIDRAMVGAAFDRLERSDEVLAYLPPAWIGQNFFSFAQWLVVGYVVNCPESVETVAIDMREVGPTYYFAPPRVFESLLTSVMIRMEDAGLLKRWMFRTAVDFAARYEANRRADHATELLDRLKYLIGEVFVYGPLKNNMGMSRLRVAYTAGEAIGPDLFSFYRSIGINLKQLYGSTETAVFVCMQPDDDARPDTAGLPCNGVQIGFSSSGEILVKTPGLMTGYYGDPAATAEVVTEDGWYRTNDAGFVDASGHLKIIDRIKDVGRLRGGAYDGAMFAPKYVENKLKFFPQIKEAVAYGDGRDKVCVLINIDLDAVGNWAERRNLPYAGYVDLAQKPEVCELIRECVNKVNQELACDEHLCGSQISRFLLLHKELDADDGELTRTNKVRRRFIAERYAVLVDALYEGKSEQYIETPVKFEDGRTGSISATLKVVDAQVLEPAMDRAGAQ